MKNYRDLSFSLQNLVDAELGPKERLVWASRPRPRFFTAASTGIVLFSIPWTTFAVMWTVGAAGGAFGAPVAVWFPLIGVPFILTGVWMFLSPIWAFRKSLRTVYAITDSRAFAIERGWLTRIRNYTSSELQQTEVREYADGIGDVIFAYVEPKQRKVRPSLANSSDEEQDHDTETAATPAGTFRDEVGFFSIDRPREVEQMLRDLASYAVPK